MAVIMLNEGSAMLASLAANFDASEPDFNVMLYENNITPAVSNVLADFTVLSPSGAQIFNFSTDFTWGTPSTAAGKTTVGAATEYMTIAPYAGGVTAYGYVIYEVTSGKAVWAERLASPISIPAGGLVIGISPTIIAGLAA